MLPSYNKKANIAAGVWLGSLFGIFAVVAQKDGGNIWNDSNYVGQFVFIIFGCSWFYALYAYAKAKGRSGGWAIFGVLSVIGLIVLLSLSDHHKDGVEHPPVPKLPTELAALTGYGTKKQLIRNGLVLAVLAICCSLFFWYLQPKIVDFTCTTTDSSTFNFSVNFTDKQIITTSKKCPASIDNFAVSFDCFSNNADPPKPLYLQLNRTTGILADRRDTSQVQTFKCEVVKQKF